MVQSSGRRSLQQSATADERTPPSRACVPSMLSCSSFGWPLHAQPLRLSVTTWMHDVTAASLDIIWSYTYGAITSKPQLLLSEAQVL